MASTLKPRDPAAYDVDFHAWTRRQADRLRARAHNDIDWENVAEEIESLGRSERREIESRLDVLVLHLLKWQFQPEKRKGGWEASIRVQRLDLKRLLSESPSLAGYPAEVLGFVYERARVTAEEETGLAYEFFPATCPFAIASVMDDGCLPEG